MGGAWIPAGRHWARGPAYQQVQRFCDQLVRTDGKRIDTRPEIRGGVDGFPAGHHLNVARRPAIGGAGIDQREAARIVKAKREQPGRGVEGAFGGVQPAFRTQREIRRAEDIRVYRTALQGAGLAIQGECDDAVAVRGWRNRPRLSRVMVPTNTRMGCLCDVICIRNECSGTTASEPAIYWLLYSGIINGQSGTIFSFKGRRYCCMETPMLIRESHLFLKTLLIALLMSVTYAAARAYVTPCRCG